jgi:hypothetical protein
MGEMRNAHNSLVGKPEGRGLLGRLACAWEDISINLREIAWEDVDLYSCDSGWGPMAGSCEYDNETSGSVKGEEFLD